MTVCTDIARIRRDADRLRNENFDFRAWLKNADISDRKLDAMVHKLTREAMSQVDCIACHNCCVELQPQATGEEVEKMAGHLGLSLDEFLRSYADGAPLADALIRKREEIPLRGNACVFLEDGRCTIYEVRPQGCRTYPHLLETEFRTRLWGVVDNCHVCPIVFSVYEELKRMLWPRMRGRMR